MIAPVFVMFGYVEKLYNVLIMGLKPFIMVRDINNAPMFNTLKTLLQIKKFSLFTVSVFIARVNGIWYNVG